MARERMYHCSYFHNNEWKYVFTIPIENEKLAAEKTACNLWLSGYKNDIYQIEIEDAISGSLTEFKVNMTCHAESAKKEVLK